MKIAYLQGKLCGKLLSLGRKCILINWINDKPPTVVQGKFQNYSPWKNCFYPGKKWGFVCLCLVSKTYLFEKGSIVSLRQLGGENRRWVFAFVLLEFVGEWIVKRFVNECIYFTDWNPYIVYILESSSLWTASFCWRSQQSSSWEELVIMSPH